VTWETYLAVDVCNPGVVPIVLTHARALLDSFPEGATTYLDADLLHPAEILASPVLAETLDLSRPVAPSLIAVLHFFADDMKPAAIVHQLVDALPSESYVVLSHGTADLSPVEDQQRTTAVHEQRGVPFQARGLAEFTALLPAGMELVEPGVTMAHRWRPDSPADVDHYADPDVSIYGLIARKP
jgi:hypothetical protein